jgi:Arc/MetJ family transcription regulator
MAVVKRTNIVIDEELVERAKNLYGLETTREVVDYALRHIVPPRMTTEEILGMQGIGWDGDLDEMRRGDGRRDWLL